MSFFERPPRPSDPHRPRSPSWWERPDGEIGMPVAGDVLIVKTDRVAIAARNLAAFSNGFAFVLAIRTTDEVPPVAETHRHHLHSRGSGPLPDEVFRFGIEFADGRKATTFDEFPSSLDPGRIVIMPGRGSSSGTAWDESYWVAPLPPPGPLAFVCEWPVAGIPVTRADLEAAALLEGP